jgi:hypothetical protein
MKYKQSTYAVLLCLTLRSPLAGAELWRSIPPNRGGQCLRNSGKNTAYGEAKDKE